MYEIIYNKIMQKVFPKLNVKFREMCPYLSHRKLIPEFSTKAENMG